MSLPAPVIDDRRYDDMVGEALRLIPRYAPEWTDHNASDPGITLIQLYAHLFDALVYRLNRVPELNYVKFLELLGIRLRSPRPARAEVTFTLARPDVDAVIVPAGVQVAAPGGEEPIVFETVEPLVALGARLDTVQSFDGFAHSLETTANDAPNQSFDPFGSRPREGSALLLGFDSPVALPDEQIDLAVRVATEGLWPAGRHCDLDLAGMPVVVALAWEYWDGSRWQPAALEEDGTRAFTRSGHVRLRGPGADAVKAVVGDAPGERYWLRCRLVDGEWERAPRVETIRTNTVDATQWVTVRDEVAGGASGRPGLVLGLATPPIVELDDPERARRSDGTAIEVRSALVEVDEGDGFEPWQEVDDFHASGPDDPHFVLDRVTGELSFGDGRRGRIPVASPSNPSGNVVARRYRSGGGRAGNVAAGAITELQTFVEGVEAVVNHEPAEGGTDAETLDDAKARAAGALRSRGRAVTAEDFEHLARETPGTRVRRAKALPLRHPRFGEARVPGVVTVIVVADAEGAEPRPSEATLALVCAHLNGHRLLTSEVHVVGPTYRRVRVEVDVVARADADPAAVKRRIEQALARWFHPFDGGPAGDGWPFGREVFHSELARLVLETEGVARIRDGELHIWLDGERQPFCRDVPIATGQLLASEDHDVRVGWEPRP